MSYADKPLGVPFQVYRSENMEKFSQIVAQGKATETLVWRMRCPKCGQVADLDDDQMKGTVSTHCECGFHETIRWIDRMPKSEGEGT